MVKFLTENEYVAQGGRPASVAEMLERVARFLDAGDAALRALVALRGDGTYEDGDEVQRDVRALAVALSERPELDAQVYALLP